MSRNSTGPRGGCTFALIQIFCVVGFIGAALFAGKTLIPSAQGMTRIQFGEFSEDYLRRKAEREERRRNRPQPEIQCWDFERNDTPKGFANALENPVPCKDLAR